MFSTDSQFLGEDDPRARGNFSKAREAERGSKTFIEEREKQNVSVKTAKFAFIRLVLVKNAIKQGNELRNIYLNLFLCA